MPLFRRGEPETLDLHSWSFDPGILRIVMLDEPRLREIADQINVPMPDKLTRGEDRGTTTAIGGRLGGFGANEKQRVESVFEHVPAAKALLRTIDLLLEKNSAVLVGSAALTMPELIRVPSLPGHEGYERHRDENRISRSAAQAKRFVLAEEPWRLRGSSSLRRINREFQCTIEVPLAGLASQDPTGFENLARLGADLEARGPDERSAAEIADMKRYRHEAGWDAAVFGFAQSFLKGMQYGPLIVAPIAIFQRSGGSEKFFWYKRRS
jgi:hypothetical protein